MKYPEINEIVFEPCCIQTLKAMQRTIDAFKWAEKVISIGLLASILIGPSGKGQSIPTVGAVRGTDWITFSQVLRAFPEIEKEALWKMAAMERLNHSSSSGSNGCKLREFWHAMTETLR